jgi:mRNA interferase RelE/StbE
LPFKLSLSKTFKKEFKKLPTNTQQRIIDSLQKVTEKPYSGTTLQGRLSGLWVFKTGKYRIIYLIDEKESTIVFLDVGLRKSIYK